MISVKRPYRRKENPSASTETGCANSDNLLTDMFELLGEAITLPYSTETFGIYMKPNLLGREVQRPLRKSACPIHQLGMHVHSIADRLMNSDLTEDGE